MQNSHSRRLGLVERLEAKGVSRRDFMRLCSIAAASVGLSSSLVAQASTIKKRPSVIWLHFQECTGCTESLLRTSHPGLAELILEMVSLDYHETLFAAAGYQAEAALHTSMKENYGKYILIVEGSIPAKDGGIYCMVGGKTAVDMLKEVAAGAAAVIGLGSCASFGGLAAAEPNPTGAVGAPEILKGKTVLTLPGCPANPYNLLGVVLQYATLGTLPKLDSLGRPLFAYARTIHEDCPRRPHFDAGRFAEKFGDENHRQGYCLYKLGCKGPSTHANCSLQSFCEVPGVWPVGIGHPCVGCTEQSLLFRAPMFSTVDIARPTPPDLYPPIKTERPSSVDPVATGVAGVIGGLAVGAGVMTAAKLSNEHKQEQAAAKREEA